MDVLDQMRVVVAVADRGSLTAASKALGRSLPTIVRLLGDAERRLGARLFERTTRRLRITDEGALYADVSRRVLADIDEADEAIRDRQSQPRGELSITAPVLFGQLHVEPVLTAFLQRHPQVHARLTLLDRVVDLIEERVDVAVRIGEVTAGGLVATSVGAVERWLCAAPALMDGRASPLDVDAVAGMPFVQHAGLMPQPQLPVASTVSSRPGATVRLRDVRLLTNCAASALSACQAGLGVAVFYSYQAEAAVREGRLLRLLPDLNLGGAPVSLVYPPSGRHLPRSRVFSQWARGELASRLNG